jgi:hypothetical protein
MTPAQQAFDIHLDTGIPVLRCQEALDEAGGDREAAIAILRKRYVHVDPAPPSDFWEQFKMPPDHQTPE